MARLARLALVPLTLAAAAAPAVAQAADTGGGQGATGAAATTQSAALLGSVGSTKLYPFAGGSFDPLSGAVNATVAGVPLNSTGVTRMFSDGLPVRDLPVYSGVMKANADAQATGTALLAQDAQAGSSASSN